MEGEKKEEMEEEDGEERGRRRERGRGGGRRMERAHVQGRRDSSVVGDKYLRSAVFINKQGSSKNTKTRFSKWQKYILEGIVLLFL